MSPTQRALRASILRVLERELESGRPFTWALAAQHALAVVFRQGGTRPAGERAHLEQVVLSVAKTMPPAIEPGALEAFADVVSDVGMRRVRHRHPGQQLNASDTPPRRASELARAAVYAEYAGAMSDEAAVQRAVTRALRERKRSRRGKRSITIEDQDPLRRVLDLPDRGRPVVASGDVRLSMAGKLAPLLSQAVPFAEVHVRRALGEDFWARCRPVGWGDARHTKVLLAVPSSPMAHELGLSRREIVRRLRNVPGFEKVKDVRFQVQERVFTVVDPEQDR
jgi:hypothetical protein